MFLLFYHQKTSQLHADTQTHSTMKAKTWINFKQPLNKPHDMKTETTQKYRKRDRMRWRERELNKKNWGQTNNTKQTVGRVGKSWFSFARTPTEMTINLSCWIVFYALNCFFFLSLSLRSSLFICADFPGKTFLPNTCAIVLTNVHSVFTTLLFFTLLQPRTHTAATKKKPSSKLWQEVKRAKSEFTFHLPVVCLISTKITQKFMPNC